MQWNYLIKHLIDQKSLYQQLRLCLYPLKKQKYFLKNYTYISVLYIHTNLFLYRRKLHRCIDVRKNNINNNTIAEVIETLNNNNNNNHKIIPF